MAKYCTNCGAPLDEGAGCCTSCGQKVGGNTAAQQPVYTPAPAQPVYANTAPSEENKPVSVGAFFGLILLYGISVVGLISAIIMACVCTNKNLKHFALATVIFKLAGVVIAILAVIVMFVIGFSLSDWAGTGYIPTSNRHNINGGLFYYGILLKMRRAAQ